MTRCLDEATLQGYFDGELSLSAMESATSHIAACSTCALAAQEIEQETSLLAEALAAEFEVSVPTEQLRQRIDAAVLGARLEAAQSVSPRTGFFSSLSAFFSFGSARSLGYASVALVILFAAVMTIVKLRSVSPAPIEGKVAEVQLPKVQEPPVPSVALVPITSNSTATVKTVRHSRKANVVSSSSASGVVANHVKLLPGERSYLKAIARLNSAINSDKQAMRPALQVEYERNLAVVDRAIAATRSAAKSNPNDPDAADFMFAAYQSKVDLLNTIADARVGGRSH